VIKLHLEYKKIFHKTNRVESMKKLLLPILLACCSTELSASSNENIPTATVFAHGLGDRDDTFQAGSQRFAPQTHAQQSVPFDNFSPSLGRDESNNITYYLLSPQLTNTKISFVAHSQGTAATLHYLASRNDCSNVASIFLSAPLADTGKVTRYHIFGRMLPHPEFIGKQVLSKFFPNFNPAAPTGIECVKQIKKNNLSLDCPIIICHGRQDFILGWEHGYRLAREFHDQGFKNVYFIEHNGGHNDHFNDKRIIAITQAIYHKHNIGMPIPTESRPFHHKVDNHSFGVDQHLFRNQSLIHANYYGATAVQSAVQILTAAMLGYATYKGLKLGSKIASKTLSLATKALVVGR
jgi:pimeloyl-ACP methyl ester carboxylesterase